jgi:hypothetical protein
MDSRTRRRPLDLDHGVIGRIGPENARPHAAACAALPRDGEPLRVLLVSARPRWAAGVRAAVERDGGACDVCVDAAAAERLLAAGGPAFDALLADAAPARAPRPGAPRPENRWATAVRAAVRLNVAAVVASARPTTALAVEAMRAGACDLVAARAGDLGEAVSRVLAAGERSRNQRRARLRGRRRMLRLRAAVRTLKRGVAREVESWVADLLGVPPEPPSMKNVTTASEFKGLIRGELDIEQLLRTTLEFVLARSGPTNAAVFLPTTSGDYSLGAYVNYDCPKDACDVLLDHLANGVAPRFEGSGGGLVVVEGPEARERYIGDAAPWLDAHTVAGMACESGGECLAIFMLFRDKRTPFPAPVLEQVRTVGELFAAQLARVIHIHHRHLPKDKWGMLGDQPPADDYGDMAA